MYHNTIRNGWTCNKKVQKVLVDGLSTGCKTEVNKWRETCGNAEPDEKVNPSKSGTLRQTKGKGGRGKKTQDHRDWGHSADGSATGNQSDPTLRLLKMLSAYWRKRFTITSPGYRKQGHKEPMRLANEVKDWHQDDNDANRFGERVQCVEDFLELAKKCEGSRDVGAQLFTALLRGIGLEARMVTSLQPLGFGWSKNEEAASPSKEEERIERTAPQSTTKGTKTSAEPKGPEATQSNAIRKSAASSRPKRSGTAREEAIELDDSDSPLSSAPTSDSEDSSVVELSLSKPSKQPLKKYDRDLQFPIYWTEVLTPVTQSWIPVDPIVLSVVSNSPDSHYIFEPRGAVADRAKQVMAYVLAYSSDGTAKDVTVRYLKKHIWPGKTKGTRMPPEKVAVYNRRGKITKYEDYDWFKTAMSPYTRDSRLRKPAEQLEDAKDLVPVVPIDNPNKAANLPHSSLSWYKSSAEFVLARHLRREEALLPNVKQVRTFTIGKGDAAVEEPVYKRQDVVTCKTAESWHKEGRGVKDDEHDQPLKHVPMRAVTLLRKREIEENERLTGEKMQQPLYSRAQTDWIIPPPIEDGHIPKNAFGNMDVYVPSMVPKGAVHIPLRGTAKICKRLDIEFAEACTGFEFGNKRAVPVLTGVVVAQENEDAVIDAWEIDEAEKKKKEDDKREKLVLGMWRKLWTGLKIVERVKKEYGEGASVEAHVAKAMKKADRASEKAAMRPTKSKSRPDTAKQTPKAKPEDEDMGGGFIADDELDHQDALGDTEQGGGFIIDTPEEEMEIDKSIVNGNASDRKPVSLQALQHQQHNGSTNHEDPDEEIFEAPKSAASQSSAAKKTSRQSQAALNTKSKGITPTKSAPNGTKATNATLKRQSARAKEAPSPSLASSSALSSAVSSHEGEEESEASTSSSEDSASEFGDESATHSNQRDKQAANGSNARGRGRGRPRGSTRGGARGGRRSKYFG